MNTTFPQCTLAEHRARLTAAIERADAGIKRAIEANHSDNLLGMQIQRDAFVRELEKRESGEMA